jgi:hypothetical protein
LLISAMAKVHRSLWNCTGRRGCSTAVRLVIRGLGRDAQQVMVVLVDVLFGRHTLLQRRVGAVSTSSTNCTGRPHPEHDGGLHNPNGVTQAAVTQTSDYQQHPAEVGAAAVSSGKAQTTRSTKPRCVITFR